ncbi:hypothetical protein RB195_000314 [Necator americanus]|uniref:Uncharacterized protein n=1 Tax=Necator americanus TaxID=51031 RepID=A0ABR1D979_NECAM
MKGLVSAGADSKLRSIVHGVEHLAKKRLVIILHGWRRVLQRNARNQLSSHPRWSVAGRESESFVRRLSAVDVKHVQATPFPTAPDEHYIHTYGEGVPSILPPHLPPIRTRFSAVPDPKMLLPDGKYSTKNGVYVDDASICSFFSWTTSTASDELNSSETDFGAQISSGVLDPEYAGYGFDNYCPTPVN